MFSLEFSEISIFAILLACCIVLLYIYGRHPGTYWSKVGVPSPPATMFIGHMDRLFDSKTGIRYNIGKWTKQYGKIFGILFFRDPALVVGDVDALKEILVKDFNNYSDRYVLGYDALWNPIVKKSLFFNRGQDWKRIRRIITPCFSSGKLKRVTHYINTTGSKLVKILHKHVEEGTHPEARIIFSAYSLDAFAGPAFALDLNSQENPDDAFFLHAKGMMKFTRTLLKIITGVVGVFPCLGFIFKILDIQFMPAPHINYFVSELTRLVEERKADPDQFRDGDFLQFMIDAEADPTEDIVGSRKLTTEEIVAQSILFVMAGYETTSSTIQWLLLESAKHKDVQKRMREEIRNVVGNEIEVTSEHCQKLKYMEAVIFEALRMYPPVVHSNRLVEKTTKLNGFTIPAGAAIFIPVSNICRDPEIFEEPETFNPDRFMDENNPTPSLVYYLPFGFGPRQCIGMRLALLKLKIGLVYLLREFSVDRTIPSDVTIDDFSGVHQPRETIRLVLSKCKA